MSDLYDLSAVSANEFPLIYAMALFDAPLSQAALLELLHNRHQPSGDHRPYDMALVKECLTSLCTHVLVRQEIGLGYVLREDIRMAVLLHLQRSGNLKSWVKSVRDLLKRHGEYKQWKPFNVAFCRREVKFSVFAGNNQEVMEWRDKFYNCPSNEHIPPSSAFFANADGIALFATLDPISQALMLSDLLVIANWKLDDCRAAYDYGCQHAVANINEWSGTTALLCLQAVLRGDFPQLSRLTQRLPATMQYDSLLAMTVLRGDFGAAMEAADSLIKVRKAETGKRKVFIPDLKGLLYTVALLGKNDAASLKRAKEQVDDGVKQQHAYAYLFLQPLANHLAQGVPLVSPQKFVRIERDVDSLFEGLALYWQDAPKDKKMHDKLVNLRSASQRLGYYWVAAELDVLLQTQYGDAPLLPDWHAEHQIKPLVSALQREETWQRALSALAQLKSGSAAPASAGSDVRIAWLLELHHGLVQLDPREQKRSAKGVWSKGRAVALKRLAHEQDSLPGMSEQDKRLATCVRKTYDNYYGGSEYEMHAEKALTYLIGHPAVFWSDAPDVRIDIVKGEVALQLKEKGGLISLQLDPPMIAEAIVSWRKETPTRLAVYAFSPEIKQIAGILGAGLTVPTIAKAQLVDVIAAIAPHLAIHSDLPELAQHIATIPANPTLFAHLLPLKDGLRLQLLVRPLPDGGWFPPGKGAAHVLGEQGGSAVQASRSLKDEAKSLKQVIAACPTLAEAEENDQEWQLQDPELCLELLGQLKALPEGTLELVWPEGERFRLKGSRSLAQMRLTIKKQGEWFVAGGEITLDDGRVLALRELMQLAEGATGRFLKLGDNDYLALTDNFRKRLDELRALGEPVGKDGLRINPLAAPALAELAAEVGELQADSAWREQVIKLDSLADFIPLVPSTLQAELRDYQLEGYQWLARLAHWGVGACLADDMGLGKTVQALALLLDRAPQGPALVVAPISVAMNWQAEVARFAPTLKVRAYHSNRSLAELGPFDIVIASYGMLQSDAEAFSAQHWHSVVLDEAQVIKNAATKRSQAAMALTADFKMIASGTPVENHLGELWNLFRFINPGLLGSKERFAERFSTPIERGDKPARLHLKKLIQPFILRRTKTQVLSELPSRTEITLQVELSEEERHLYEALRQEAIIKIANLKAGDGQSMQVLAEITKLRRFCCNPKLVLKNSSVAGSKLAVFADTVEELLENRHKALVFSQFVDHLAIVREWLEQKGISYQYLDGSTPALERKKRVDAFQAGQGDIFLISLKAGGTGLNLTAADYVIHLDPWWNPAVEDQASDRAHRMGQLRPVTIYRLVAQDTIEEKIIALHAQKRDLADSLLDGGDAAGRMDTAALLRLLKESV
ncbi:MAG: DEAD/DEAH box helicase [Undibacterium sp.]|uniref:DEAD/DEAH box helicase n=1 Tax=Undibacterium sp. TaxID=1914977 RepID=UPI00271B5AB9|nr:DEAD/DEAH box helicase [Undibacterium sp.]MDO8653918.1 DEAD/DEAH box helicase [Undibacterium sp.]